MYQKPILMVLTAGLAWFAIVMQFCISIPAFLRMGRTLAGSIVELFSFFTILSNLLLAVSLTAVLLKPASLLGKFFLQLSVSSAIAVYITIVGLVYNLVLRQVWDPHGLFKLTDELLHLVVPVLYLIYWLIYVSKAGLKWGQLFNWLLFPLIYLIYIIIRGAISGYYPYPFINVVKIGYIQVALNFFIISLTFIFFSVLFILAGRLFPKKS